MNYIVKRIYYKGNSYFLLDGETRNYLLTRLEFRRLPKTKIYSNLFEIPEMSTNTIRRGYMRYIEYITKTPKILIGREIVKTNGIQIR